MAKITFRNKPPANSLEELVDLCNENWNEAKQYLYSPWQPFNTFLEDLSKETEEDKYRSLAEQAISIVSATEDQDIGLEKFLQATGLVDDPTPDVSPKELVFNYPNSTEKNLKVTNKGRGYLYGRIKAKSPLDPDKNEFGVASGESTDIKIKLKRTSSGASTKTKDEITIETNAKKPQAQIKVKVSITGLPEVVPKPEELETDVTELLLEDDDALKEQQKQRFLGCIAFVIGLAAGVGALLWIRHRTDSIWLMLYSGYLVHGFVWSMIAALLLHQRTFQATLSALLLPVGHLAVLCGTYVLWQRWYLSIILAVFLGHLLSRQLQATFCWNHYLEQRGAFTRAWQNFERERLRRSHI